MEVWTAAYCSAPECRLVGLFDGFCAAPVLNAPAAAAAAVVNEISHGLGWLLWWSWCFKKEYKSARLTASNATP